MDNRDDGKRSGSLTRRDLLKVMTAAPAAALGPLAPGLAAEPARALFEGASQEPHDAYKPKFFNAHQYRTITVLSDLIVPADERSGKATQAGVPEFVDDWLSAERIAAHSPRHRRGASGTMGTEVLGSLTWMDMQCNRLYAHDFIDCSVGEQKQILDRIAYPNKAAPEDANAVAAFNRIRDLVLGGFFSSEMGIKDLPYLGNQVVEEWKGCPQPDLERLGVSYNEGWMHWKKQ